MMCPWYTVIIHLSSQDNMQGPVHHISDDVTSQALSNRKTTLYYVLMLHSTKTALHFKLGNHQIFFSEMITQLPKAPTSKYPLDQSVKKFIGMNTL